MQYTNLGDDFKAVCSIKIFYISYYGEEFYASLDIQSLEHRNYHTKIIQNIEINFFVEKEL